MLSRRLLGTLTVIAATAIVPGSAAADGPRPDPVRPSIDEPGILATQGPSTTAVTSGRNAPGTRAGGEVLGSLDVPAVKDGTTNTTVFAARAAEVLTLDSHTRPHADGIIAILIGAIATSDDRRGQDDEELARPRR